MYDYEIKSFVRTADKARKHTDNMIIKLLPEKLVQIDREIDIASNNGQNVLDFKCDSVKLASLLKEKLEKVGYECKICNFPSISIEVSW